VTTKLAEAAPVAAAATEPAGPVTDIQQLIEADAHCGVQNYGRIAAAFVRGRGARLWDIGGREYLDFLGGIAVVTVGHSHPRLAAAVAHQMTQLQHTSNIYYVEPQTQLAARLSDLAGGMRAFFCNSGAEANEAALKMARRHVKLRDAARFEIISTFDSFHGRTYGSLAATGQPKYHEGFEPMPEGFVYVPRNDIAALEAAINPHTAAILLEPIQGESGIWPMDAAYLRAARELCDRHGLVLIFDEVQCGMGRTGKFFAAEWAGVRPDIITMAKGLANGIPIGALLARDEVAAALVPGTHGCTFGGNFISTTAALTTLDVLFEEELMQNAQTVGAYFGEALRRWGKESGALSEVRQYGLMVGASLTRPVARELMRGALAAGLIFNAVGDSLLRFLPPLCITTAEVDEAMATLAGVYNTL
jgi:predicted acetylornithine/succinylornithine family transaminase